MLSLRVVFVALAVVCAAQAYAVESDASSIETYSTKDVSYVFDKIVSILEQARERVKELDRKLKEAVEKGYVKVQAAADRLAEQWNQAIQKAVEQANKYGVDVSECVSENYVLKEIVDRMVEDSRQCIVNEEQVVDEVQQKLDALLQQQQDLMDAAKQAFEECKDLPLIQAVRCNVKKLVPLAREAAQVLASTGAIAGEVAVIAVKSANNVRVCVNGVFRTEGQAAKEVIGNATRCIRDKVQGNQQFALY